LVSFAWLEIIFRQDGRCRSWLTHRIHPPPPARRGIGCFTFRCSSPCRSAQLIGNGTVTVVISRWEKEISAETLRANLAAKP
jgi:hypothetical protein